MRRFSSIWDEWGLTFLQSYIRKMMTIDATGVRGVAEAASSMPSESRS
jgi:hypothetical protein